MGVSISKTAAYYNFNREGIVHETPRQVLSLAGKSLSDLLSAGLPKSVSHLIVSTSCPDMLAPSLGQMISEQYNDIFGASHTIDLVQGCTGGVTALILGSQLAELNKSTVVVLQADAAQKATSKSVDIHRIFGSGSFACCMSFVDANKALLHYKSKQYDGLSEVVTINLGHDADQIIIKNQNEITRDPRKYLGLSMNNKLALQLLRNAESFYQEFINESINPDAMILHQVNPQIINHLRSVFSKYPVEFIDSSALTGNCGAASVGIAFHLVRKTMEGKKVLLCSFGTGGVITAGLWQN